MMRIISIFLLLTPFLLKASKPEVQADFLKYVTPDGDAYLEIIYSIDEATMTSTRSGEGWSRKANVAIWVVDESSGKTVYADKFSLQAEPTTDSLSFRAMIDVRRLSVKNGSYKAHLFVNDAANERDTTKITNVFEIGLKKSETFISDVLFLQNYKPTAEKQTILTKSGYDIIPKSGSFFPKSDTILSAYVEVLIGHSFQLAQDKKIVVNFFIENADEQKPVSGYGGFVRDEIKKMNVYFRDFLIKDLPSGNYHLCVEIRNRNNELLANKKVFFQRSNPVTKQAFVETDIEKEVDFTPDFVNTQSMLAFADTFTSINLLADCIKSLYPISTTREKAFQRNQLNLGNLDLMKRYFHSFWVSRDEKNPGQAWAFYLERVKVVLKNFSTRLQRGYETDRGRVYLQYGEPNTMDIRRFEPNSYPYEIWHYYRINNTPATRQQSDKRFVFYSTDRSTNDYRLLHSTAIGEVYDERWQLRLNSRNDVSRNLDDTRPIDEMDNGLNSRYGSRSNDQFRNPY